MRDFLAAVPYQPPPLIGHLPIFDRLRTALGLIEPVSREHQMQNQAVDATRAIGRRSDHPLRFVTFRITHCFSVALRPRASPCRSRKFMKYTEGELISLVVTNQQGKRIECTSTVIGTGERDGPYVEIASPEFNKPPKIELITDLIERTEQGLRYRGEIGGAVLIPDFLWVSP